MIMKNFEFKPIFLLATNAKIVDVEMFDLSPPIITFILEPLATTFISKSFVTTSSSKPLVATFVPNPFIVAFALEPTSKLVNKVHHTSTTKKKKDYEGTRKFKDKWVVHFPWASL